MRHTKTVPVPAYEKEVEYKVTCDVCGVEIKDSLYAIDDVEVRHRTGSEYPDGGMGQDTSFDICGQCFDTKLVPWLRTQGARPRIEEWDY